jgi:protein TonB
MFEQLIESQPRSFKSFKNSVVSLVAHVVLGYLAIKATTGAAEQLKAIMADTTMVFLKPADPPPPPPPPPDAVVPVTPPPLGFQTVAPPTEMPKDIPPINLTEKFDAKDFSGKGVEGGIASGVAGGAGPITTETFLEAEVDDPVQIINQIKPKYPPVLQQAGIAGSVDVQYVVGLDGRVEHESWRVLRSTNKAFEEPAREAIFATTFKPAKIKGQAVRQLVQQRISFNIGS